MNLPELHSTLNTLQKISNLMQPIQNPPPQFKNLRGYVDLHEDLEVVEISLFTKLRFYDVVTENNPDMKLRVDFEFPVSKVADADPAEIVAYVVYIAETLLTRDKASLIPGVQEVRLKYDGKAGASLATKQVAYSE